MLLEALLLELCLDRNLVVLVNGLNNLLAVGAKKMVVVEQLGLHTCGHHALHTSLQKFIASKQFGGF